MPVTNIRSSWSSGDLIFHEATSVAPASGYNVLTIGDDAVTVGDGSNDIDFKAYFGSTSNYFLVDEGNEKITVAKTWAVASATGRPFEVDSTVNAALGSYSNAIKGYVVYGTSGRTTGLGSAVCAEILLSAGTSQGTYAPLESEIVINTSGSTGTATSFLFMEASGTAEGTFDDNGYLFQLNGVNSGSAHMWYDKGSAITLGDCSEWLRVKTPSGARYLALYDSPS